MKTNIDPVRSEPSAIPVEVQKRQSDQLEAVVGILLAAVTESADRTRSPEQTGQTLDISA
jgi:hypothetical protein